MKRIYKLSTLLLLFSHFGYAQLISADYSFAQVGPIPQNTTDAPILKIKIVAGNAVVTLDSLTSNAVCSTNFISDVSLVKLFFTDSDSIFSNAYPSYSYTIGMGNLKFMTAQILNQGDNYFWITYDVTPSAITGDFIGGLIDSLYIDGNAGINPQFIPVSGCIEIGNLPLSTNNLSVQSPEINLYPNPANGIININNPSIALHNFDVTIVDIYGHIIVTQKCNDFQKSICMNLSKVNAGVYVAKIKSDGITYFSRLVKE